MSNLPEHVFLEPQVQEEVERVERQPGDDKHDHHAEQEVQGSVPPPAATSTNQQAAARTVAATAVATSHPGQGDASQTVSFPQLGGAPKDEAASAAAAHLNGETAGNGETAALVRLLRQLLLLLRLAAPLVPEGQRRQLAVDSRSNKGSSLKI